MFQACEQRKRNIGMPQQAIGMTRHPFLLRGLISCATSGRKATCALQKGQYVYLMVRNPANQNKILLVKEQTVVEQITDALKSFAMPEDLLADVLDYIQKTDEQENVANRISAKELQAEQVLQAQKLSRLTDLLIDGSIGKDIYEAKNKEILLRRQEIESRLKAIEEPAATKNGQESLGNVITMLSRSAEIFASSKIEQKRRMLRFVFSNLEM